MTTHQRHRHIFTTVPAQHVASDSLGNFTVSTVATSSFSPTAYSKTDKSATISPRMKQISRPFVLAMDCFFIIVILQVAVYYYYYVLSDGGHQSANDNSNNSSSLIMGPPDAAYPPKIITNSDFQPEFYEALPSCDQQLQTHQISFSLAIPLEEQDLHLVKHHCQRWGIYAPISIAVYTTMSPEQVMRQITTHSKGHCHATQLSITTLIPTEDDNHLNVPTHEIINLAIQNAPSTHVLPLDRHLWSSLELYETLHSPKVLHALVQDPQLMVVVPAFEMNLEACSSRKKCERLVPRNYDDLIVQLGQRDIFPMHPENYALMGSTKYRKWITQPRGQLLDIECVSSDQYQPFVVVRKCQRLPPFQENIMEQGGILNDSTWIAHLIRLGYRMKQIGGEFVVYMNQNDGAVVDEQAVDAAEEEERSLQGDNTQALFDSNLSQAKEQRIRRRQMSREDFNQWLDREVPDHRVIHACEGS